MTPNFFDQGATGNALITGQEEPPPPADENDYGQIAEKAGGKPVVEILPPEFADDALALEFSRAYGGVARYVDAWGRWFLWDGHVWKHDDTLRVVDVCRHTCRSNAVNAPPSVQKSVTSAKTIAAVERLARADRRHAATIKQWDADPWLLNTPGGIVDLQTGETSPHDPNRHMTKITTVSPGGECPMWLGFLNQIMSGDQSMVAYLQRVCGYCLTGITREHAMWFAYGTGRNGKGVMLNTLTAIMGDYALTADPDTFTATGQGRHLTVLARLQGARLVVAQETEQGVPWAEARVKQVTGGDPITANFMRQDPFTFIPQFKLFMAGNHKPALRTVDEAIKARFNLVPFEVTIPATERDPELPEKLKDEWPGILRWMIDGCMAWQRDGLASPDIVRAATDDYLAAEDALAIWIAERCKKLGYGSTETKKLFTDWNTWAKATGEQPGTMRLFSQELTKRGYKPKLDPSTRRSAFEGIALDDVQPSRFEAAHERE